MGSARNQGLCQNMSLVVAGLSRSLLALAVAAGSSTAVIAAEDRRERLEEVQVTGTLNLSRQTSIGKLDIPVDETPFSISLRDKNFFDATGSKSVQDVLQYSAGVNGGLFGVDARGDWSSVRGVAPVMFIDGLQSIFGSYTSARANLYAFERVEILKGPSSVLYGQGSTGGIVNLVSKRPQSEFGGELMVQGGDYDRKVIAGDVTGALDNEGKWLYRVVGYARDADAQVDHVEDNSTLFMPSISWRPSADTEITFLANYQYDKSGTTAAFLPYGGTRVDNSHGAIPTDTFLSEPDWDKYDTQQIAYSVWIDHRFSDNWGFNAGLRYSEGEVDYNSMFPSGVLYDPVNMLNPNVQEVYRTVFVSDAKSDLLIFDLRISGEMTTGPFEHQISFGLDRQDAKTANDRLSLPLEGGKIDLFNPVYGYVPTGLEQRSEWRHIETETEQLGFYLQDQITHDNWIFSTGLRRDFSKSETVGGSSYDEDATTLRFGVMYSYENGISPYASYSESFEPVAGTNNAFKPIEGEQVEVGIKYQPEGTSLLITASAYEITQKNRLTRDLNASTPNSFVQLGEVEIDGVELEASGRWGDLSLVANYSHLDTEITESFASYEIGTPLETIPEEQFSLWANYDLSEWVQGLKVGLGARHVGKSYAGMEKTREVILSNPFLNEVSYSVLNSFFEELPSNNPSYTLYDATIGYTLESWNFQLNVKNLTDEIHTTSCLSRGDCFYGERRYVTAEARYTF
ncbi:TonB-dependent siderophore receptor [uncultured Microbulbifer sp.]|uniref:TonB-dependent siderophore receptor n=1 Tax=uncultured Microbulbifer sp. TaxID=348147 RepID=UPI0026378120|nr:TonB-dependent siderophore receptor [uncultured Microbulbifer sp.]